MMTMDQLVAPAALDMLPGFTEPSDAAQRVFRGILDALSRPGQVVGLPAPTRVPAPLDGAAAAIGLSLLDGETRVFLPVGCDAAAAWLRFHTGCRLARNAAEADFVIVPSQTSCPDLETLRLGSDEAPHLSATLVVAATRLEPGAGPRLTGPGIDGETRLEISGLEPSFLGRRAALACLFPRGIDVLFTCGTRIAALPRTTRLET
jgi:alpha-D-ribose 1-methylphosphonate 5-triphosphate synthase subunit PhnH